MFNDHAVNQTTWILAVHQTVKFDQRSSNSGTVESLGGDLCCVLELPLLPKPMVRVRCIPQAHRDDHNERQGSV